jgi:hypothetical protein
MLNYKSGAPLKPSCARCAHWKSPNGIIGSCDSKFFEYEEKLEQEIVTENNDEWDIIYDAYYSIKHETLAPDDVVPEIIQKQINGKLIYWDGSGYSASFATHKNFGCIYFEPHHENEMVEEQ